MSASAPSQVHFRTCNLCEAMCGVRIEVADGRITSIKGDDADPFSRGHICPKAVALRDLHEDPDRLRHPMKRTASGWERVSWEDAFDDITRRLHALQQEHGPHSVGAFLGNPNVHNMGAMMFGAGLLRTLRSRNLFSATSVDQLPHQLVAHLMFGHQLLIPIPDIDRTRYMLILGANPLASNGSLMTSPDVRARLRAIQERGGKVVVIDPRRTETAHIANQHVFVRPGTDALALLSLLHVVLEDDTRSRRLGRLAAFVDGLDSVVSLVRDFPPERTAPHTGIAPEVLRGIARDYLAAEGAVCYGRVGVSTHPFGSLCQWLINTLNIVTGNLDREGGALFTQPAFDIIGGPRALGVSRGSHGRWKSRVRGLPEFSGELPVAALAEEILTPGDGRIRALLTVAGNPVLSTPNGTQLDTALGQLDLMVSVDPYLNETTRHAHYILPPTSVLERGHYDLVFHVLAVRNTAKYSPPVFTASPESRQDWEILLELQHRLETLRDGRTARATLQYQALKRLGPERLLDVGLRMGPYGSRFHPLKKDGLSLAKLRAAPHGIDLGPLKPSLPGRLGSRSKRIQLAPELLVADVARLRSAFPDDAAPRDGELLLIGRRHLRDNNSWMHNVPGLVKGRPRCTLLMHPEDASRLGLTEGSDACVRSRVGEITVPVAITDDVMPGVVSLPHGYGHQRAGIRLQVAGAHAGASINDLTDEQALDTVSGNAAFSGTPVRVRAAAPPAPPSPSGPATPAA